MRQFTSLSRVQLGRFLVVAAFLFARARPASADSCRVAKPHTPTAAEDAYLRGDFSEAEALYRQALSTSPNDTAIVAGLIRSLLRQQKFSDAAVAVQSALTDTPQSSVLLTALAEVQYRQGLIVESGKSAAAAYGTDLCYARVHLIRARLAGLNSMYATERREISAARALDPYDPDIRAVWVGTLPLQQRIDELKKLRNVSAGPGQNEKRGTDMYLDDLERLSAEPLRRCRLASAVASTTIPLASIVGRQLRPRAWALIAKFNDKDAELMVDTGSSGLYISRRIAEKAGLKPLDPVEIRGFGDDGPQSGFSAYVDRIRIGNLEFRDCLVNVSDRKDVELSDGLVGLDIFSNFLVSIDIPLHKLELSPLPLRPGELVPSLELNTAVASQDGGSEFLAESTTGATPPERTNSANSSETSSGSGPRDRYIAPEMKDWFPVFRVGHDLIIPGMIDKNTSKLFVVDTGAEATILSKNAASEIHRIYETPRSKMWGVDGQVKHVYDGGAFSIRFADKNLDTRLAPVVDLSTLSNDVGTEIAGVIGLPALELLTIHIDYRDGLVKFDYDPAVVPDSLTTNEPSTLGRGRR